MSKTYHYTCEYDGCTKSRYAKGFLPGGLGPWLAYLCREHWETKRLI